MTHLDAIELIRQLRSINYDLQVITFVLGFLVAVIGFCRK